MAGNNLTNWQITNGWREILARIFEGFESQYNVSPEWLVNPATRRHLKLDLLYPDIGVAVRFEGVQGKQRPKRLSLEEEQQLRTRNDARVEMSQAHGIHLIVINVVDGKPPAIFRDIDIALSRVTQPANPWGQQAKTARTTAATLSRKITTEADLQLYADLWNDRQYRLIPSTLATAATPLTQAITYVAGMEVEHTTFGPGVVLATTPSQGDTLVTVDFVTAGQKTLAASLVASKLMPR